MKVSKNTFAGQEIAGTLAYNRQLTPSVAFMAKRLEILGLSVDLIDISEGILEAAQRCFESAYLDWVGPLAPRSYLDGLLAIESSAKKSLVYPPPLSSVALGRKWSQFLALDGLGLAPVNSLQLSEAMEGQALSMWLEQTGEKTFLAKPNRSSQGLGIVELEGLRSAVSFVDFQKLRGDLDFVLQPKLKFDRDLRALFLPDRLEVFRRFCAPGEFRANLARGGVWQRLQDDGKTPEIMQRGEVLARTYGLKFFALDFLEVGEELYTLEVNLRPGLKFCIEVLEESFLDDFLLSIFN